MIRPFQWQSLMLPVSGYFLTDVFTVNFYKKKIDMLNVKHILKFSVNSA